MLRLKRRYQTRPVHFLHLAEFSGWQIKVYGIRYQGEISQLRPDQEIVRIAEETILPYLPQPAVTESRYGLGFMIVHQGQDRNWLLLDWWHDQEILKQRLFSSPPSNPGDVTEAEHDLLACTWEMAVHCFERDAWVDSVLKKHENPDFEGYLSRRLTADI